MKTAAIIVSLLAFADAYTFSTFATRRSTMTMKKAGRGRKKMSQAVGTSSSSPTEETSSSGGFSRNWKSMPTAKWNLKQLQDNKVQLYDTNLETMKDKLTNPTGAVSVLKYNGGVFCFSSSCPSCKIPMTGAKVLPATSSRPTPLIACNFCKSAYDLKTGAKTDAAEETGGGLFAGLAQNLFKASNNNDPLKTYQLGEKDGQVLIAVD